MASTPPDHATSGPRPGAATGDRAGSFDVRAIRADFPALCQHVHGHPLIYLDSAATTHKPRAVIDAIRGFYERDNANVHRATHALAARATDAYEGARAQVASYIGAPDPRSVVFTSGNTAALNLAALSYGGSTLGPGDRVIVTMMEHHSNIVPWQMVCARTGAELVSAPITDSGEIDLEAFDAMLDERARIVALPWVSNVLGTINPVARIARRAGDVGAVLVVDGAQCVPHVDVDVQAAGIDFLTLAGHKAFGPTGIGALYARPDLLERMAPIFGGGEMIEDVSFERSTYAPPPARFEAGTPNIAGAVGMAEALRYVRSIGIDQCKAHCDALVDHATRTLRELEGATFFGRAPDKAPIFTFTLEGCHPYDTAPMLDHLGIAVRTGHHCAQPLTESLGQSTTIRASCSIYTTQEELDRLCGALSTVREMLR